VLACLPSAPPRCEMGALGSRWSSSNASAPSMHRFSPLCVGWFRSRSPGTCLNEGRRRRRPHQLRPGRRQELHVRAASSVSLQAMCESQEVRGDHAKAGGKNSLSDSCKDPTHNAEWGRESRQEIAFACTRSLGGDGGGAFHYGKR